MSSSGNGLTGDPIQALLAQTSLQRNLFTSTSRYYGLDTETMTKADGTTIVYLTRRFLPSPALFQLLQEHTVTQGERLDNIAAKFLGNPELFWRLADANGAMRPEDLVKTVGKILKITLPQGITGSAL
jgi:hypothetical protein